MLFEILRRKGFALCAEEFLHRGVDGEFFTYGVPGEVPG
jgi:hypothetical protein